VSTTLAAIVLLAAPLTAFALIALLPPLRRRGRLAGALTASLTGVSLAASVSMLLDQLAGNPATQIAFRWLPRGRETLAEVGLLVDGISAPMAVVVALVAFCVQVYSLGYLSDEPGPHLGRYFAWHALFVVVMEILVLAPNLLQLFIGWELVGLCSYLLIGYYWREPHAGRASLKAFWVNKFADSAMILGLVILVAETGGFGWDGAGLTGGALTAVALLLFCGTMGKSAQVPLHVWLPDAMAGPTPVSALLHAATMVAAGVYLIVRGWPLFSASEVALTAMLWIGSITAVSAAVFALLQEDLKKLLAFSTCSQLGYMVAALGAGGLTAGYFHLTTHAFFKALLFLGAGSVIHAVHSNDMSKMGGLYKKMPLTCGLFVLGSLALMGFPLTSGFFSKDMVLESVRHASALPFVLLIAGAFLTATYTTLACLRVFAGPVNEHAHESPLVMMVPMLLLGVGAAGAGYVWQQFGDLVGYSAEFHYVSSTGGIAALATLAGIAAGAGGRRLVGSLGVVGGGAPILSDRPLDGLYEWAWRRLVLAFSRGVAWVDRYLVDGLMNVGAVLIMEGGARARRLQTSRVADYIWAVAVGLLALMSYSTLKHFVGS